MALTNRQIHLVSRPTTAEATLDNFALVEAHLPEPHELSAGQVLVKHHFLSLDPFLRGRMNDSRSYAKPQPLHTTMLGATVGEVLASKAEGFAAGDHVSGWGGWQEYQLVDTTAFEPLDPSQTAPLVRIDTRRVPMSAYLGAVGLPGVSAWYGINRIIVPKVGETIVVSSAGGSVGSTAGQLAKLRGCRVIGVAGGEAKCRYVVEEFGFDACIDYKAHPDLKSLVKALAAAAPDGIDGCFENVGGMVLDAVLTLMNGYGRIALCGLSAGYSGDPIPITRAGRILLNRLKIEGMMIGDHTDIWVQALAELGAYVAAGQLHYRESISQGLDAAPEAFLGLLRGQNTGKQLIRLV